MLETSSVAGRPLPRKRNAYLNQRTLARMRRHFNRSLQSCQHLGTPCQPEPCMRACLGRKEGGGRLRQNVGCLLARANLGLVLRGIRYMAIFKAIGPFGSNGNWRV